MHIQFKKLNESAKVPTRGSEKAAGYDIYACIATPDKTITIMPHTCQIIGTGFALEAPEGTFAAVFPRSGLSTKYGLRLANCVGVCDEDYRGEYMIAMYNDSDIPHLIRDGERIAQLIFIPYVAVEFEEVPELTDSFRGVGGFGSTGID